MNGESFISNMTDEQVENTMLKLKIITVNSLLEEKNIVFSDEEVNTRLNEIVELFRQNSARGKNCG